MADILSEFPMPKVIENMAEELKKIKESSAAYATDIDALQSMFNAIDLTTLNTTDSEKSVAAFVERVNQFAVDYPDLKNVGGICVYPVFAPVLKSVLKQPDVFRAVVAACFPSSQTFVDIKCAEVKEAVQKGANEVDIVISVGEMLAGNYDFVREEVEQLNNAATPARLKVILETGSLETPENIWKASILAMSAGADMIKTSTGKNGVGATPEAAFVMCQAIKAFNEKKHRKVGFKPAGGVRTVEDACYYYNIVRTVLGDEWSGPKMFRIGASGLANALLNQILKVKTGKDQSVKYF